MKTCKKAMSLPFMQFDGEGNERDYWAALMPDDVAAYEKKVQCFLPCSDKPRWPFLV